MHGLPDYHSDKSNYCKYSMPDTSNGFDKMYYVEWCNIESCIKICLKSLNNYKSVQVNKDWIFQTTENESDHCIKRETCS